VSAGGHPRSWRPHTFSGRAQRTALCNPALKNNYRDPTSRTPTPPNRGGGGSEGTSWVYERERSGCLGSDRSGRGFEAFLMLGNPPQCNACPARPLHCGQDQVGGSALCARQAWIASPFFPPSPLPQAGGRATRRALLVVNGPPSTTNVARAPCRPFTSPAVRHWSATHGRHTQGQSLRCRYTLLAWGLDYGTFPASRPSLPSDRHA
jgi:hypothetical protein